ncbi:MAG: signal peptide peptidase SppA [Rhodocyclaceae bacterium]
MIGGLFRFIGKLFVYVWRWLDALRRTLLNLVFLLLIAVLIAAFVYTPELPLPERAALVVRPAGMLVEQRTIQDPFELLRPDPSRVAQTTLRDLVEAIEAARDDARITALVLETDHLTGAGLSKLAELRAAIIDFKRSGKPVLARGERFTQGQYYLASAADEVHVSPDGFVLLRGLSRYVTYFKGALDALGVKMHVFRVGEYKSFSEPFTRSDMSDEDRENSRDLLDALWNAFRTDVAESRGLSLETLDRYVQDYRAALIASSGDAAGAALEAGLVDRLSTRDEWRALLRERVGRADGDGLDEIWDDAGDGAEGSDYKSLSVGRYLAHVRGARAKPADKVAVLVAQGGIVDGRGSSGSVGGDALARLIRQAREDDNVRAVVLRIDSPGGSAFASEVIRRELEITRAAGKPVIASMSSTAASGGYWIAAGADEIWAHPTTLTGSIGIFAMFPEFAEPLNRVGITVDGVATGPLAGAFDPRRPLDAYAADAMQVAIRHGYDRFLKTVSTARGMPVGEVDLVARGQVWTGEAAAKLGLVDGLGGLGEAVAAAAARAQLREYEVVWLERRLSPAQLLMQHLNELAGSVSGGRIGVAAPELAASPLAVMLAGLQREAEALLSWNDPQHLYAHCLCGSPE